MPDDTPTEKLVALLDRVIGERNAAIQLGEQRCRELHQKIEQLRIMRREIKRAIQLLKTGKAADALIILQGLSREK